MDFRGANMIESEMRDRLAAKNAEIARLRAELASVKRLLTDKTYIQCKADYYRGHLSHANYLNERERAAFDPGYAKPPLSAAWRSRWQEST